MPSAMSLAIRISIDWHAYRFAQASKKGHDMLIAMATWEGRLAPVLDVATEIVIADVGDGAWNEISRLVVPPEAPRDLARMVLGTGSRLLLCGAASRCFSDAVRSEGLQVVDFLAGTSESIAEAWVRGSFEPDRFAMPGCGRGRGRCRGRRRGGRGA